MAKTTLKKVRVTGFQKHYKLLMQELHKSGVLQVIKNENLVNKEKVKTDHYGVFDLSQIQFAIDFLTPYASKKSKLDTLLSGGKIILSEKEASTRRKEFEPKLKEVVERCSYMNERLVRIENELAQKPAKLKLLEALHSFDGIVSKKYDTAQTLTWIGEVDNNNFEGFQEALANESNLIDLKILSKSKASRYVRLTIWEKLKTEVQDIMQKYQFEKIDIISDFPEFEGKDIKEIKREMLKQERILGEERVTLKEESKLLSTHVEDLKIVYDVHTWGKERNDKQDDMYSSEHLFMFDAWVVESKLKELQKWIQNVFVGEVSIDEVALNEGEEAPVKFKNRWGIRFFEPVVEMYGLPKVKELDPTPLIAPFFFVFFGLCLSDVGYGLILFIAAILLLAFGKFSQAAKDSLWLILFCGFSAILGGIVLGGYFGMTAEQFPLMINPETGKFYGQLIDPMVGSGPIIFLSVALALGAIQLLFGLMVAFYQNLKNKNYIAAVADNAGWFFFLLFIILYILAPMVNLDKGIMLKGIMGMAIFLVLTQGRDQKNWLLKPVMGVLSLYDVTAYLSDLLSYSRIMALGLATGVVGFAMNITAGILGGMMPHPVLGVLLSIAVIIMGHSLNFGLSLLGAFIHSGRLQFIEFFGRFYEGGGEKFDPFARQSKYVFVQEPKS